ncbi:hypothetical protein ACR784_24175 [Sphingobacterium multivorum]|uniref:hypothetical protein n=1 Tax=Sphingobacterium multivorum TaxID=28454 RepID=UPI003DA2ED65
MATTKSVPAKNATKKPSGNTGKMKDSEFHEFFVDELKDIYWADGYNVEVDPSAGHTDPSNKAFFSPTDDLTILLLFS